MSSTICVKEESDYQHIIYVDLECEEAIPLSEESTLILKMILEQKKVRKKDKPPDSE